jgi:hypothetical protein
MFEFFGNIFYLLLLALILIITYIVVRNSWSKEILSKQPNALIWNNSLIILNLILFIVVFIRFSWIAGILTLVLASILYIVLSKKIMKEIENNILESAKLEGKSK